jgi:hypothetical protein
MIFGNINAIVDGWLALAAFLAFSRVTDYSNDPADAI